MLHQLIRLPLKFVPKGLVVPILSGPARGLKWVTGSGTHGCWLGTYERDRQKQLRELLRPGDCFLDIGANVGFFTVLASRIVGRRGQVHSFEPAPRNVEYLKRHVELNNAGNITTHPMALSNGEDRTMSFSSSGDPRTGHLVSQPHVKNKDTATRVAPSAIVPSPHTGEKVADRPDEGPFCDRRNESNQQTPLEVQVTSLDTLWSRGAFPRPSVIKIDVEGAEFDVLQGGRQFLAECQPTILLAGHGTIVQNRCSDYLKGCGYRIHIEYDGSKDGMYESTAIHNTRCTPISS